MREGRVRRLRRERVWKGRTGLAAEEWESEDPLQEEAARSVEVAVCGVIEGRSTQ